jgi:hypothetical protein
MLSHLKLYTFGQFGLQLGLSPIQIALQGGHASRNLRLLLQLRHLRLQLLYSLLLLRACAALGLQSLRASEQLALHLLVLLSPAVCVAVGLVPMLHRLSSLLLIEGQFRLKPAILQSGLQQGGCQAAQRAPVPINTIMCALSLQALHFCKRWAW